MPDPDSHLNLSSPQPAPLHPVSSTSSLINEDSLFRCIDYNAQNPPPGIYIFQCPDCDRINILQGPLEHAAFNVRFQCQCCKNIQNTGVWYNKDMKLEEYHLRRICWACGKRYRASIEDQLVGDICGDGLRDGGCRKPADGTDELIWVGYRAAKERRVDLGEEMQYWKEVDKKMRRKIGICEVCGKICKAKGGLASHVRNCKGELKSEYVNEAEKLRARDCIEVDGRGV